MNMYSLDFTGVFFEILLPVYTRPCFHDNCYMYDLKLMFLKRASSAFRKYH